MSTNHHQDYTSLLADAVDVLAALSGASSFNAVLKEAKFRLIVRALENHNGTYEFAAQSLGYRAQSLFDFLKKHPSVDTSHGYDLQALKDNALPVSFSQQEEHAISFVLSFVKKRRDLDRVHKMAEKKLFENALRRNGYDYTKTAQALGLGASKGRQTVRAKVDEYGIDVSAKEPFRSLSPEDSIGNDSVSKMFIDTYTYAEITQAYNTARLFLIARTLDAPDTTTINKLCTKLDSNAESIQSFLKTHVNIDQTEFDNIKTEINRVLDDWRADAKMNDATSVLLMNCGTLKELRGNYNSLREAKMIATYQRHGNMLAPAAAELEVSSSTLQRALKSFLSRDNMPPPASAQNMFHRLPPQSSLDMDEASTALSRMKPEDARSLRHEMAKALIARTLLDNHFEIDESAAQLGLDSDRLVLGISNYFCVKTGNDVHGEKLREKVLLLQNTESPHQAIMGDYLPHITQYEDLRVLFRLAKEKYNILIDEKREKDFQDRRWKKPSSDAPDNEIL